MNFIVISQSNVKVKLTKLKRSSENNMTPAQIEIISATDSKKIAEAKKLIQEYGNSLKISLDHQNFKQELKKLPGEYVAPKGRLLLAYVDGKVAGCVALREFANNSCEMKRLYVKDNYRGQGIGKQLVTRLIEEARSAGYEFMKLDTIPGMTRAQQIYESYGFYDINPFVYSPVDGTRYMELKL